MPTAIGCSLSKDVKWHNRWIASYRRPGESKQRYKSVSYATTTCVSVREALLAVIRWAWEEHFSATGEACPHDLSG